MNGVFKAHSSRNMHADYINGFCDRLVEALPYIVAGSVSCDDVGIKLTKQTGAEETKTATFVSPIDDESETHFTTWQGSFPTRQRFGG